MLDLFIRRNISRSNFRTFLFQLGSSHLLQLPQQFVVAQACIFIAQVAHGVIKRRLHCRLREQDNPAEAKRQLLAKIVERVFVYNGTLIGLVLHGDFAIVLGQNEKASLEIRDALTHALNDTGIKSIESSWNGADGDKFRARITLILIAPYNKELLPEKMRPRKKQKRDLDSLQNFSLHYRFT